MTVAQSEMRSRLRRASPVSASKKYVRSGGITSPIRVPDSQCIARRCLDDHPRLRRCAWQVIVPDIDERGHQDVAAQRFHEVDTSGHHAVGVGAVQLQMLGAHADGHWAVRGSNRRHRRAADVQDPGHV